MSPDRTAKTVSSPVGSLHLAATAEGLTHLLFADHGKEVPMGDGSRRGAAVLTGALEQLAAYFEDGGHPFDVPLAAGGTVFQRLVWNELRRIPTGRTLSYAELARRIGRPRAVRAVGAANGANPISIIVPCHRVVGADGRLTGFGGGLSAKAALLRHEGLTVEGESLRLIAD